jgi:hypothetical protein
MQPSEFDRLTPRQMVRFLRLSDDGRETAPAAPAWATTSDPVTAERIHRRQNALTEPEWQRFKALKSCDKMRIRETDENVWNDLVARLRGGK